MPDAYMEARTYGVGQLISERRLLRVPDHQRDYAWTEDVVEQFLDDVARALESSAPDYFLGLIVLVGQKGAGVWEILDGQQRLATGTMIYSAIRQWMLNAGLEKDAHTIQSQFIGVTELGSTIDKPRVTLNITNRSAFSELVISQCSDELLDTRKQGTGRFSSDRKLIEALQTCRRRISELARKGGGEPAGQAKRLYALADHLRDNVKVVCLDVPSAANAYVIFESLNDRGLDLSVLDLVKNHMFGEAGPRLSEVQADWTRMVAHIGDRQADDFLKVFWTSRKGRIQRGRLFDEWRRQYAKRDVVVALARELGDAAEEYSALDVPDHELWSEFSPACRRLVGVLAILGNKQVYPILLAARHSLDPLKVERLLEHLIALIVRYQIIGRGRTGALEIQCARVAPKVFSGDLNSPLKVWTELAAIVPADEAFRGDFATYSETKPARARYLLRELEMAAATRMGARTEMAPAEALTLEHIFPKNASDGWKDEMRVDPDLRALFVNRLGNLCLLEEATGRQLGSAAFKEKKLAYARSQLRLTAEVGKEHKTWDRDSIEKRQRAMAELALQAWPRPA